MEPEKTTPVQDLGGRLLTLREVAYMLHAHPNSIRSWSDSGLLPAVRIGRRGDRRFRQQDVEQFLQDAGNAQASSVGSRA